MNPLGMSVAAILRLKEKLRNPRQFTRGGKPCFARLRHVSDDGKTYMAGRRSFKRARLAGKKARYKARLRARRALRSA